VRSYLVAGTCDADLASMRNGSTLYMSVLILGGRSDLTVMSTEVLDNVFNFLIKLFSLSSCVRDIWNVSVFCIIFGLVLTADLDLISVLYLLVAGIPISVFTFFI